jgi:glutamyl-tRNA synthetase
LDLNGKYIRAEDDARLADLLLPFLADLGCSGLDKEQVKGAVRTLKPRANTLVDMAQGAVFYFKAITYDKGADEKFLRPELLAILEDLLAELQIAPEFTQKGLEGVFSALLEKHQIKLGKVAQPVRVALTGKTVSPGIFEVMEVLGRENVIKRLANAIFHIKGKKANA